MQFSQTYEQPFRFMINNGISKYYKFIKIKKLEVTISSIKEEVSIKLMIQVIKLKQVPVVKSRKRKKKEVKVRRRKQTLAQAEECQTLQLLLSSVIRIIPQLTCT